MNNLCCCGCGQVVEKSKSKGYTRKYANGHERVARVLNYRSKKTKKCNGCKKEKNIGEFSVRNFTASNGLTYERLRSRCKKCEGDYAHNVWTTNPELRSRRREYKRNDRSLKSLIQNRIASWKKKTPNSDLTTEYLLGVFEKQEGKCYYTGQLLETLKAFEWKEKFQNSISLDRLDPDKGYMQGNVVFCSYVINTMKGTLTEQAFYEKMKFILANKNQN